MFKSTKQIILICCQYDGCQAVMEVGMKICILIPHLCTVPLSTERTPKLPGVHPKGDGSFSGTFSSPRLLLCAKHNSAGDALNSSEISAVPHLRCK